MLDTSVNPRDEDWRHSNLTDPQFSEDIPAGFSRTWPDVPTDTWRWTDRRHWSAPHPTDSSRIWVAIIAFGQIVGRAFPVKGNEWIRGYANLTAEAARIAGVSLMEPADAVIAIDFGDGEPCMVFRDDDWDANEPTTAGMTTTIERWREWTSLFPSSFVELCADAQRVYTLQPTTTQLDYDDGTHLVVTSATTPTRWTLIRRDDHLATRAAEVNTEVDPTLHHWFEIASGDETGLYEDDYRYDDEPPYTLDDLAHERTVYAFRTFQATSVQS